MKVRGEWTYLYRAVDKFGTTIGFYLSSTRNAKAAKRFPGEARVVERALGIPFRKGHEAIIDRKLKFDEQVYREDNR